MKILFAAPENAWGGVLGMLRAEFPEHEFVASGRFGADTLKGFDVMIPTMCPVTREMLRESDRLRLIQQCGAGLEGVDIEAARERNIWVANVPTDISGNADSVADIGVYLMIGLSREARAMSRSILERKMGVPRGRALSGKTAGVVGLGGIGRALVRRLKAFGMRVIGVKRNDPRKAADELGLAWAGGPDEMKTLLGQSDFVILTLPLTDESRHLMNRNTFGMMKKDAFLINLSRGGLVDRDSLEEALAAGRIAGAGLDVFWEEPPDPEDPIFQYNVIATPHIGGATDVSITGIKTIVAENIRRLERGEKPLHVKN